MSGSGPIEVVRSHDAAGRTTFVLIARGPVPELDVSWIINEQQAMSLVHGLVDALAAHL